MRRYIIALDPATVGGYAVFRLDGTLVESGTWTLPSEEKWLVFAGRLRALLRRYDGDVACIAVERPTVKRIPKKPHYSWHQLARAFGFASIVELVAQQRGIECVMVMPADLKKSATGRGNATKADVVEAMDDGVAEIDVKRGDVVERLFVRLPFLAEQSTSSPKADKRRSDEADARAVGIHILASFDLEALECGEVTPR